MEGFSENAFSWFNGKWGGFNPVSTAKAFSKQSVRSDGWDGIFQSNLEQIFALINDSPRKSAGPSIEVVDENLRLRSFDTKGRETFGGFGQLIKYQLLIHLFLSWPLQAQQLAQELFVSEGTLASYFA